MPRLRITFNRVAGRTSDGSATKFTPRILEGLASKRTMRKPTRQGFQGRLIRLSEWPPSARLTAMIYNLPTYDQRSSYPG